MPAQSRSRVVRPESEGKSDSSLCAERSARRCPVATSIAHNSAFASLPPPSVLKKLICFESGAQAMPRVNCPLKLGWLKMRSTVRGLDGAGVAAEAGAAVCCALQMSEGTAHATNKMERTKTPVLTKRRMDPPHTAP